MSKHDENKDVRLLSKIAKIDERMKTIQIAKSQLIGNKRWGRIDFLTHYCGYKIIWSSTAIQIVNPYQNKKDNDDNKSNVKEKKELHKLSNKNSKTSKKK